jgi:hypothetical protein
MGKTFSTGLLTNGIWQDASNNIGIGAAPSGSYKLEVTGTLGISGLFTSTAFGSSSFSAGGTGYNKLTIRNTTAGAANGAQLSIGTNADPDQFYVQSFATTFTTSGMNIAGGAVINGEGPGGLSIAATQSSIGFYTNGAAAGNLRMTIGSTGNTLFSGQIKTTFAGQSIAIDGGSTASVRMQLQNTSGNAGVTVESSTGGDQFSGTSAYSMAIGTYTAKDFYIGTNSVQRFKISSTGSATFTADIAATEFNGTNAVTLNKAGANGIGDGPFYRYINSTNSNQLLKQLNASSGEDVWAYASGAWNKIGNTNFSSGTYTALSDVNKKKDFELSTLGLDAILGLKPTLYRIKSEDENADKQLGFIAQEVKDFIPQAYVEQGEEDGKFIGLNYNAITATLVKAVQEQNQTIQELNERLNKAGL